MFQPHFPTQEGTTPMNNIDINKLKKAREYLVDENHWGKNNFIADIPLEDSPSYSTIQQNPEIYYGHKVCILGACALHGIPMDHALSAFKRALMLKYAVVSFNDNKTTTHADILAVFDRAIKIAEEMSKEQTHEQQV
jgi:hypothetical protein